MVDELPLPSGKALLAAQSEYCVSLINSFNQAMFSIDSKGTIQLANLLAREWFDCHPGRSIIQVFPGIWPQLSTAFTSGARKTELPLRLHSRNYIVHFSLLSETAPLTSAACVLERIPHLNIFHNEQEMSLALETLIDSTSDGLCICNHEGEILRINRTSARFYGADTKEMIGRNVTDLVAEGLIDQSAAWEVIKRGEVSNLLQQRGDRKLLVTGTPIHDNSGNLLWVVVSEKDVTEIDTLRRDLEEQKAIKDEFQMQVLNLQNIAFEGREIIYRTPNMIRAIQQALKVSKVDSSVLILGESGVGKGIIADLIHKNSNRANMPIIKINCGAIPESLIESELFGYEKGAFTGAQSSKPGYFEIADGGLLFLDEIAELPHSAQVKLLHFLEDGELTRLGGTGAKKVDVRIIAATHRNLEKMIRQRKFRHDLYYRLNVIPIHLPALRERKDCILPMIHHFLNHFCAQTHTQKHLTQAATEALLRYDYPGNVRELMNLCERLVVMSETEIIDLPDIPPHVTGKNMEKKGELTHEWPEQMSLQQIIESVEREVLSLGLKKHFNQARMAEALDVNQSTITRKLKRYGIR
ncbi:sigma 54-interacting transcriptional regulator [uncultured Desulfuromusa sp.]|uniref:sigma-54 interaction domain-containing protein n=1 Tax=uncultured Desulfuromusa sp. TaxID=219183 RepID=UPI002AA84812|nr:sigma 54-interacting transcriptional regulator [uncultured Desulfuromusa sp.]